MKTALVITDSAGTIKAESDYYPWGGELQFTNSDTNHYKFTGKERDGETGLDYFGARYYSNALGRFVTPDWAAKAATVPYAEFADPQSLNLYSYVRNLPTTHLDLDGHVDKIDTMLDMLDRVPFSPKDSVPHCICEKFPTDPSGLGPEWNVDPKYKNPNGVRYRRADGWGVDYNKAGKNKSGRSKGGKDHWHVVKPDSDQPDKYHYYPGDDIPIPSMQKLQIPEELKPGPSAAPATSPCGGTIAGGPCDGFPSGPYFIPGPGQVPSFRPVPEMFGPKIPDFVFG